MIYLLSGSPPLLDGRRSRDERFDYFDGKEGLLLAVVRQERDPSYFATFFERPLCTTPADDARETTGCGSSSRGARSMRISRRILPERRFA